MNGLTLDLRVNENRDKELVDEERASPFLKREPDQVVEALPVLLPLVLIKGQALLPSLVDSLAEDKQDWMGIMQNNWEIDVDSLSLLGIQAELKKPKKIRLTIQDFVVLTRQNPCQSVEISQRSYWFYTCCLQVVGLGRVRAIISFDNPQKTGNFTVFCSNRLDFSPRSLLNRWFREDLSNSRIQDGKKVSLIGESSLLPMAL